MKHTITMVVIGAILLGSVFHFQHSKADSGESPVSQTEASYPYLIQVTSPSGDVVSEYRGVSTARTSFLIAQQLGADPYETDRFSAFPDISLQMGSLILMQRTPSYSVIDGKKRLDVRSWATTVGELFLENSISLGKDDKINFSSDTSLKDGMVIVIIRVARTTLVEEQSIDYKTIKQDDPTLDKGKTKTKQAGVTGKRQLTYEVVREDGVEISKTLKKNEVVTPPTDEIILVGTKPVITGWCKYNDLVIDASAKNGLDPNRLCSLMKKESNGNPDSVSGGGHKGLFQYTDGFWADASSKAGYAGADWSDPRAQIYTTAWALAHGYSGRW